MSIIIRAVEARDEVEFVELVRLLNEHEGEPTEHFDATAFRRDVIGPDACLTGIVAAEGDRLLGYVLGMPSYEVSYAARGHFMLDIYVREEAMRRGIGRRLVAALAAHSRSNGGTYLWWTSYERNARAHAFYKGLGATADRFVAHALIYDQFQQLADEAVRK